MIPHIIPGHITALYIFAVINLMALFHITLVEANIVVLDDQNRTRDELLDLPSKFGPPFPEDGTRGHIVSVNPPDGCQEIHAPPTNGTGLKWIALIKRRNCDFDIKVLNAQKAGYVAALVFNIDSDELIPMGPGQEGDEVTIPSAFIGEQDAYELKSYSPRWSVLIDNRVPFNANLYLLPFAIVVGICFILMLIFMIAKWVRDLRKRRRARLSREHLKKLPTKKFKKGDPYDMCAICLDEYEEGDKLRILPCSHAYHMKCVDPWLTKNKRTCPVCKRKVIPGDEDDSDSEIDSEDENDAPSETTPLLTAQAAGQLAANNSAFQNSGAPSDAHSAHQEDLETSDSDDVPVPSTSVSAAADVHAPLSMAQPGNRRQGGYGSLSINTNSREEEEEANGSSNHGNLQTLEPLEGAGANANVLGDPYEASSAAEMRGVISSNGDEEDEDVNTTLRVKIISLFKNRKRNRRRRRNSAEDA